MQVVSGRRYGVRHGPALRYQARQLRLAGMTVPAIARHLNISKGTVSIWVRDQKLDASQLRASNEARISKLAHSRRLGASERASKWREEANLEWGVLRGDPLFILGVGLYWGEGEKLSRCLGLSNSDPKVIRVWCSWLRKFAPNVALRGRVSAHADVEHTKATIYWRGVSGVQAIKVYLAVSSASAGKRPRRKLPYGTFSVQMCVGARKWHTKMMTWIGLAGKM